MLKYLLMGCLTLISCRHGATNHNAPENVKTSQSESGKNAASFKMLEDAAAELDVTNCCVCQYMPIDACANVTPENWQSAANICEDCTFLDGSTPQDWIDACKIVEVNGSRDCEYDEASNSCMSRFKKTCIEKKNTQYPPGIGYIDLNWQVDPQCGENFVIVEEPVTDNFDPNVTSPNPLDFKHIFDDMGLSCDNIWWFRHGHDLNFCKTAGAIEACLECTSGVCNGINIGCSVLQNWEEVEAYIAEIRSKLQVGQTVRLQASQAVTSKSCRNMTNITITGENVTVVYPNCEDLGFERHSYNDCHNAYEMAKCTKNNGTVVWHQCCPAHREYSDKCVNYNQWQPTDWDGTSTKPLCPSAGVITGKCDAIVSKDEPNPRLVARDMITPCYDDAYEACAAMKAGQFSHS